MSFFLEDTENFEQITWSKLVVDIDDTVVYNKYCKSSDYYNVFRHIIISMLFEKEIILLDSDFTDSELLNLTGFFEFEKFNEILDKNEFQLPNSKISLIDKLKNTSDTWKITLFTSGTTGVPKKVTHNFESISRFVKFSELNKICIWGFAYNPTHMAGVQVFLQALLNGNSIVRLFGLAPAKILNAIETNKITHISATPTFYRLLLPCERKFESIQRITSGGEKFNSVINEQLLLIFPKAKFNNIYASTETGTLFASHNDLFSLKIGFEHLIKIVNDELLIHVSLMGEADIKDGVWYKTGDLVEVISNEPLSFRFISRNSDMINVGGYKVNPTEVEEIILTFPGIINVRVFSKSNSVLGNIICCEVVRDNSSIEEISIRIFLQSKIQEFKIPRIFRFVNELSTTRTGKIKRN